MQENMWYDLDPPANIQGKIFHRVLCEYQVPGHPNEFSVRGIPTGGTQVEAFILRFTDTGRVQPTCSADQSNNY